MTDVAHIIEPDVEVGDKSLTLCGKKHRVEVVWDDVPAEQLICRDCVDTAISLLNVATDVIATAEEDMTRVRRFADLALDAVSESTELSRFLDASTAYQDKRQAKQAAKRAAERSDETMSELNGED